MGNWERLKEFGSSMEKHERTCKAGVGRGQIGVRVCVRAGWGWDDNMLSGNERESQMASARNYTLSGASVENEPGSDLMFP